MPNGVRDAFKSTFHLPREGYNVFWVPGWLYEKLPVLYVLAGIASLSYFGFGGPSALSSALLFVAAVLTYTWRRKRRLKKAIGKRR